MKRMTVSGLEALIAEIRTQLQTISERVERIEKGGAGEAPPETAAAAAVAAAEAKPVAASAPTPEPPAPEAAAEPIPEEDLLAISAALAAYFGVRVRARQIRLISSPAWAQQGRVSIQASHRLMH